jgi:hypothetical protein
VVLPCVPPIAIALRKAHQFGQHLGAAHHRQEPLAGRHQLGIVLLDGGGDHNHFGVTEIGGRMADMHLDALIPQPLHIGAFGLIRALNLVAEIVQHLGDAAHADAADADKVHQADCLRHLHAGGLLN